jgi:hypothetical protein
LAPRHFIYAFTLLGQLIPLLEAQETIKNSTSKFSFKSMEELVNQ